jgi:hypothetical protein
VLRCGGDGGLIRYVELERTGVPSDAFRRRLLILEIAGPDEHGKAVRRQVLRDLKSNPFVSPVTRATGLFCMVTFLLCVCEYLFSIDQSAALTEGLRELPALASK